MDTRIVRFGIPVDQDVKVVEYVAPGMDMTYEEYTMTIWVDEGLTNLVPHHFKVWYVWFKEKRWGPLRGFDGPLDVPSAIPWDHVTTNVPDGLVSDPKSNSDYDPEHEPKHARTWRKSCSFFGNSRR